jgi:hypothetical protein
MLPAACCLLPVACCLLPACICSEIAVDKPFDQLANPVVAAQHFEYKMSNILGTG